MSEQISKQLRSAIISSGQSAAGLGAIAGVKQQTISEFLRGAGISLSTAQKLADHFGLVLKKERKRKA
jgi:plasmid maintenance system antidote protein VapI